MWQAWREKKYTVFVDKPEEMKHLLDPRIDMRIILKLTLSRQSVGWIYLAQLRDKWWAPVNTVMNIRVTLIAGNFVTSRGSINFSNTPLHEFVKCI
jgi:hypothetical protein